MEKSIQIGKCGTSSEDLAVSQCLNKGRQPIGFTSNPVILREVSQSGKTCTSKDNKQDWNISLTRRGNSSYDKLFQCPSEFSQEWVHFEPGTDAARCKIAFTGGRKENRHRFCDSGAFTAYASLQASELGYQIHQLAGFSPDKLMLVIGKPVLPGNKRLSFKRKNDSVKDVTIFLYSFSGCSGEKSTDSRQIRIKKTHIMETRNNQYDTLVEALNSLYQRGYIHNFRIDENGDMIEHSNIHYASSEVQLNEYHRFEGMTNPSDMSIVYAVETINGEKGTVVDSYGVSGTDYVSNFMNKVQQSQFRKTEN